MVHLNKSQLSKKQLDDLFLQLNTTLGKLSVTEKNHFLTELLGYEERIMLAKRLACIILLLEGKSFYKISKVLKISPSTANSLQANIETGVYNNLIKLLGKNKEGYSKILETLNSILNLGSIHPDYSIHNRWKILR